MLLINKLRKQRKQAHIDVSGGGDDVEGGLAVEIGPSDDCTTIGPHRRVQRVRVQVVGHSLAQELGRGTGLCSMI